MPYIKKKKRLKFEKAIQELVNLLQEDEENLAGNLNYIVTTIIKRLSKNLRYNRGRCSIS